MAQLSAYLKLSRTHAILGCFGLSSGLLMAFADVDIGISRMFFDQGFVLAGQRWSTLLHDSVRAVIVLSLVCVSAIYAYNRLAKRNLWGVDGRKVVYLLLVLVLGAGLIVNVALKDHFGRARPRDIGEFGGSERFTPAFVMSDACDRNCSFSSGDSAGAFFTLAFVLASRRKRVVSTVSVGFGILVSVSRIATGAHFFSDTVVSFFVMLIVADALHYLMFAPATAAVESARLPGAAVLVRAVGAPPVPP